ncbi:hypothetical protein E4P39_11245 [Blastococcus sp. CT_GayMR19]|uniref:endo-1,3-alpha-glucanase family glycosylhydrolase n=1 Tax=Blastococcus sp. CT_GayMR19 TaxID=2559608 RepID=UPI00107333D3|nr:endo-1,3-alpha-glucanase family glycosylhydrolase [Blastococcus sp. CT_GayMR19]TFV74839.1 hypothetical protein E4P39_11245 [Blastococcus sp. CT_GayMR19]
MRALGPRCGTCLLALTTALCILLPAAGRNLEADAQDQTPSAPAIANDCPAHTTVQPGQAPVLAHFYIWFQPSSWNRAKTDFPTVGRYSSSQTSVMRQQVAQARAAGIDGFIVGWRSTDTLNPRLAALRSVAEDNDFKLAITYQAQDFNRNPLPVAQVQRDLEELAATYADDPVFHLLGRRPVVALSGTWHYTEEELRSITAPVASRLLVLATEKNVADYERVAATVEGELYYWSSGDPEQTRGYREKLLDMANAVREHCGVWVAPVMPGYDARELGGTRVVVRRDGETLRSSWEAALATVPDAIGVISWNEFSENTHIEPSTGFGTRYLDVLGDLTGAPPPPGKELDSSDPQGVGSPARAAFTVGTVVALVALLAVLGIRRRRQGGQL